MECFTVRTSESHWDEPYEEVLGNAVYESADDAKDAAEKAFDAFLSRFPDFGKHGYDVLERNRAVGVWHAWTKGESYTATVEQHSFVPKSGKRG